MKRVLIVGADFTPSSHPPALRIRFFAQHLREFGWEPVVLTTDPAHYETEIDSENERLLPPDLEVVRTSALPRELARKLGFGDVALRSLWHHWRALVRICRERPVDLILVPIPPNWTMLLGRFAYIRLGIPYVIDYSDPVGSDYYWKLPRSQRPPKYALVYSLVRKIERFAIKRAAHIVAVSRGIAEGLAARYPWVKAEAVTEIPFGGDPADLDYLRRNPRPNRIFNPKDGHFHLSYIGAYTPSMEPVLKALFAGLSRARADHPQQFERLRLHFVGTNYAPGQDQKEQVRPIAAEFGVADIIDEHPGRVPYLDALSLLLDSDALLVVGSVEPHYTASKIFPYILAARPLLTIFHEQSSVVRIMEDTHAGEVITFGDGRPLNAIIEEISESFRCLLALPRGFTPVTRWETFGPYTTRAMAARLAAVFDEIVSPGKNADSPSGRVGSQRPQSGKAENDKVQADVHFVQGTVANHGREPNAS